MISTFNNSVFVYIDGDRMPDATQNDADACLYEYNNIYSSNQKKTTTLYQFAVDGMTEDQYANTIVVYQGRPISKSYF